MAGKICTALVENWGDTRTTMPTSPSRIHIFGIRHHGPGSARSLCTALQQLQPDILLVEGPPDAEAVLPLLMHEQMRPPVALLIYPPDHPQNAVYYPFAVFSPEWQAIHYGLTQQIPVRLMDLPQSHQLAIAQAACEQQIKQDMEHSAEQLIDQTVGRSVEQLVEQLVERSVEQLIEQSINQTVEHKVEQVEQVEQIEQIEQIEQKIDSDDTSMKSYSTSDPQHVTDPLAEELNSLPAPPLAAETPALSASDPYRDPLRLLAEAAGYSDSERWWEHLVEQRQDSTELFAAILTAMTELRSHVETCFQSPTLSSQRSLEPYREAYMRKTIREAEKQGFQRIAVVCGAWHAPALAKPMPVKPDQALLKGLPKIKVEATWVPWTYGRLTLSSGYGAGIESPGWYHHLWDQGKCNDRTDLRGSTMNSSIHWMTRVARLLRQQDLDVSSASVIEAVRLAETLAALRDRPVPGLPELNEATQTVLCFGDVLPMQFIHQKLIVGERLGKVPAETPMIPLQQDLQRQQKRLRLKPEAVESTLSLDLRKPLDLERSHLLHQLALLQIPWGQEQATGNTKGTFREVWRLQWQPEFVIRLIEAGIWGSTIATAATVWTCDRANQANLPDLTRLIDQTFLANLPQAIAHLMTRLQSEAAVASDMMHLMNALPPLVNVTRYGTVRQFDTAVVGHVVEGLVIRICIGLPMATASLDAAAAVEMHQQIMEVHGAIALLQRSELLDRWHQVLVQLSNQQGLHGRVAGRCCRLLFEAGIIQPDDMARRLGFALSSASEPTQAAAWIEGFLAGSGLLLLHNPALWQVLDAWVMQLSDPSFTAVLPLLRRTFSTFAAPERRQMGERVRQGGRQVPGIEAREAAGLWDGDRADAVLPLVAQLLGITLSR